MNEQQCRMPEWVLDLYKKKATKYLKNLMKILPINTSTANLKILNTKQNWYDMFTEYPILLSCKYYPDAIDILIHYGSKINHNDLLEIIVKYNPQKIPFFIEKGVNANNVDLNLAQMLKDESYIPLLVLNGLKCTCQESSSILNSVKNKYVDLLNETNISECSIRIIINYAYHIPVNHSIYDKWKKELKYDREFNDPNIIYKKLVRNTNCKSAKLIMNYIYNIPNTVSDDEEDITTDDEDWPKDD